MKCPKCDGKLKTIDTVHTDENEIYRKRKCSDCGHIIYTAEYIVFPNQEFLDEYHEAYRRRSKSAKKKETSKGVFDIKHARWQISTNPDDLKGVTKAKCSTCGEIVQIGRGLLPHTCPGCDAIMN